MRSAAAAVLNMMPTEPITCDPSDLRTPEAPSGYMTVANFLLDYHPNIIDLLDEPGLAFFDDAERLQTFCEKVGYEYVFVATTPAYTRMGKDRIRAFPMSALLEFYTR